MRRGRRPRIVLPRGGATSLYYSWSKTFFEARKRRFANDTARQAKAPEIKVFACSEQSTEVSVADRTFENRMLKQACLGMWTTTLEVFRIRKT